MKILNTLAACTAAVIMLAGCGTASPTPSGTSNESAATAAPASAEAASAQNEAAVTQNEAAPSPREGMAGVSDKDISKLISSAPAPVNNDVTGKWFITQIAADEQFPDYALSYYKEYITSPDQVHFIVNRLSNITYKISGGGNCLYMTAYNHVDGEENDAKALPSGDVIANYIIYTDNGDIDQF